MELQLSLIFSYFLVRFSMSVALAIPTVMAVVLDEIFSGGATLVVVVAPDQRISYP